MDKTFCLFSMMVGVAVGGIAVMMLPRQNPARKLAKQAADSVEDVVCGVSEKVSEKLDDCF